MDFDLYVVARRRLLLERAVELGLPEADADGLVDAVLAAERRRVERAADPDPALFAAVEDAVRRELHVPSPHRGRVGRVALVVAPVLVLALVVGFLVHRALQPPEQVVVPSTFALESDAAATLLREAGLRVRVEDARGCEPLDLVVGSSPDRGASVDAGSTVTLMAAGPPEPSCAPSGARRKAWSFLRFTRGGPAPAFDDTVFVVYNGREPAVLSRAAAADPARWAAIQSVADVASGAGADAGATGTPRLRVTSVVPPPTQCGFARPDGSGDRRVLRLLVVAEDAGCPFTVDLYLSGGDEIDAVVVYDAR